jgi:arylsulfatase A-like enzyme
MASGGALAAVSSAQTQRPNVLFILVDDLGWADLGVNGSDFHETPNIDRLFREGMQFPQGYAAAPICSPTRAALLSGKSPARLNMTVWREQTFREVNDKPLIPPRCEHDLPLGEYLLSEALRDAGYLTAHVGKWHLGDADHYPENQGFDINVGGTHWGAPQTFFWPYSGNKRYGGEPRYVPDLSFGKKGEYLTDRLTDEAIEALREAGDRPWFLHMSFYTVHTPVEAKSADVEYFRGKLRPGLKQKNPVYAARVKSIDDNVGRLLHTLEEAGQRDRTLIIFTSDNGGFERPYEGVVVTNNSPLRSGKGSLYEGGIRVPTAVAGPGIASGVSQEPVISMDWYPTLVELAGVETGRTREQALDGVSLARLLRGEQPRLDREAIYFHFPHYYPTSTPVSAIREGDWKLLEYFEDGRLELYHLTEDPGEEKDLAEIMPEKAQALLASLRQWRGKVGATLPKPNPEARQ